VRDEYSGVHVLNKLMAGGKAAIVRKVSVLSLCTMIVGSIVGRE